MKRRVSEDQAESFTSVEAARDYAEHAKKHTMRYQAFLQKLRSLDIKGRYLDVGAGAGTPAAAVAKDHPTVRITALEVAPAMVQIGKEYIEREGLEDRVAFVLGDAADEDTVKALGTFDLIYSTYSLHHWKVPETVIRALLQSLSDDGVLYLYDLRRVWWLYWLPLDSGFIRSVRGAYVRREIEGLLDRMGVASYEVKNEFPFLVSVVISRKGRAAEGSWEVKGETEPPLNV